jgi:hypothetical protein
MKLGNEASIHYTETLGSVSIYELHVEGRPVMRITADLGDPNRMIRISRPTGLESQETTGVFSIKSEGEALIEDAAGDPIGVAPGTQRVSGMSVQRYIAPRALKLLARLYVPKSSDIGS